MIVSATPIGLGAFVIRCSETEDRRGTTAIPFDRELLDDALEGAGGALARLGEHGQVARQIVTWSRHGTIRGMHFGSRRGGAPWKLVRVSRGKIIDVMVDLRRTGPDPKMVDWVLAAESRDSLLVPPWCAHGFAALEDSEVNYLILGSTDREEKVFGWDSFGMRWPFSNPTLSDRDAQAKPFHEVCWGA